MLEDANMKEFAELDLPICLSAHIESQAAAMTADESIQFVYQWLVRPLCA
jgi:hypothetical protein